MTNLTNLMIVRFYRDRRIPEIKHSRLNSKNVAKLITLLARRFNLGMDLCPQTSTRQSSGGLRYLFHKKYDERSIGNRRTQDD